MSDGPVVLTENQRAIRVAQFIEFDDLFLSSLKAELLAEKDRVLGADDLKIAVKYDPKCKYSYDTSSKAISVRVPFLFELTGKAETKGHAKAVVRIESVFLLRYRFNVADPPTGQELDDYLSAFSNVNARFNAWPYFREIVQNSVARMGLPPVILPVFRMKKLPPRQVVANELSQPTNATTSPISQT